MGFRVKPAFEVNFEVEFRSRLKEVGGGGSSCNLYVTRAHGDRECVLAMSLVRRSLSFSILHLSCGFKQHREFAGASWLRTYSSKQPLRVANVGAGHGETAAIAAQPYPSREFELSSEIEQQASVALNEVAPPVSNVFGSARKEVSIFEDPAGFFRNRAERKVEKVKQALQSVEEAVAPSAFSPTQGDDVVGFFLIRSPLLNLFHLNDILHAVL